MTIADHGSQCPQSLPREFATTHWSAIALAGSAASVETDRALETLCRAYWYPLYAYVRRQGHSAGDAQDLTQDFFARLLERRSFRQADRNRGRFRTFLLTSLKHFLINEWKRANREKRGGGRSFLSLEEAHEGETRFLAEPADPATQPDRAFERQWALTLLDQALTRLRNESTTPREEEQFDALKGFVWGDQTAVSRVEVAARLGMTANALDVAVHRLRRRFGERLRETIAHTVVGENEIDTELRHLMEVVSS